MKLRMHTKANGPMSLPSICATKVDPQRNAARTNKKLYPKFAILERKLEIHGLLMLVFVISSANL